MGQEDRTEKLYDKIQSSPANAHFSDVCKLAEMVGCTFRRISGGHHIYHHPLYPGPGNLLNFQQNKGKAIPYQVKQLLAFIENNDLILKKESD
jgi:hypothetical protein